MDIQITNESRTNTRVAFELACGNKTAYVGFSLTTGMVDVCVCNASHRAWRGMGRTFRSFAEAIDAYKSPEVKAMIHFLEEESRPVLSVAG